MSEDAAEQEFLSTIEHIISDRTCCRKFFGQESSLLLNLVRNEKAKLLKKLVSGSKNIRFSEAVACIEAFGFHLERVSGSHHIFVHTNIPELVNLQNVGGKAKPYQIKQFLNLVEKHNLQLEDAE